MCNHTWQPCAILLPKKKSCSSRNWPHLQRPNSASMDSRDHQQHIPPSFFRCLRHHTTATRGRWPPSAAHPASLLRLPSTAVAVVDVPEPARPGESSCTATASRRKEPVVKVARTGTEQRGDAGEAEDQGSGAGRGLACVVLDAGR